jgi:hypothetical protein
VIIPSQCSTHMHDVIILVEISQTVNYLNRSNPYYGINILFVDILHVKHSQSLVVTLN